MTQPFFIDLQVRDHELDQYGVVNNAVYLTYLEHARHEFLHTLGIDPAQVAREGASLALAGITVRFRAPLRSRQQFRVAVTISALTGVRAVFHQTLTTPPGGAVALEAWAEAVFLDPAGRPRRIAPSHRDGLRAHLEPAVKKERKRGDLAGL